MAARPVGTGGSGHRARGPAARGRAVACRARGPGRARPGPHRRRGHGPGPGRTRPGGEIARRGAARPRGGRHGPRPRSAVRPHGARPGLGRGGGGRGGRARRAARGNAVRVRRLGARDEGARRRERRARVRGARGAPGGLERGHAAAARRVAGGRGSLPGRGAGLSGGREGFARRVARDLPPRPRARPPGGPRRRRSAGRLRADLPGGHRGSHGVVPDRRHAGRARRRGWRCALVRRADRPLPRRPARLHRPLPIGVRGRAPRLARQRRGAVSVRSHGRCAAAHGRPPNDPRVLRAIFPWPNRGAVEAEAAEFGVDPLLFVAIVRQESVFDPEALSPAGARGLAQLLPGTAALTARGLDVTFSPDWITVPDLNLHLGAAHLAELLRRFGGRLEPAIAAYNAGVTPVTRWVGREGADDPDRFIELIPYQETRGYVRSVLRNRELYRALYGISTN